MLADHLNNVREQTIAEMEQRANTIEGPGVPSVGRTQRLNAIFDDLVAALRYGGVNEQGFLDSALDSEERELLRHYVIEQIRQHQLEASPAEAAIVSEWACTTESRRLREENRRLRSLLDGVDESAVILTRHGRFAYLN